MRPLASCLCSAVIACALVACGDDQGPAERTGEAVDEAAGKTGEALKDGAQRTGEAVERAGEKVQDAAK